MMNKFIWEKKNSLSSEFCKKTIFHFERDLRKRPGMTIGGEDSDVKKSDDIHISLATGWGKEDGHFFKAINETLPEYQEYCHTIMQSCWANDLQDSGYQIQRTIGGEGFYHWHHDHYLDNYGNRRITFIWYLNTVPEEYDGYTEFIDGTRIQPEEGKLIFFPSTWDFVHRGVMPKKGVVKYICTGWLYDKWESFPHITGEPVHYI